MPTASGAIDCSYLANKSQQWTTPHSASVSAT